MQLNLKTTVSVPTEVSIELETPAFFKNPITAFNEFIGVLDECTITIILMENYSSLNNSATETKVKDIKKAYDSWEHISEEEFFEALDKALKDFNFKPSLVTTSQLMEGEEDRRGAIGNW